MIQCPFPQIAKNSIIAELIINILRREHRPFTLQVSLGEMNLEDSFWVELAPEYVDYRLGDFLDQVFSGDRKLQAKFRSWIDVKENPDLPDMYTALLEIFSEWRSGKCSLHFFANQGPEIKVTDRLDDHLSLMQSPEHRIDETPLSRKYISILACMKSIVVCLLLR